MRQHAHNPVYWYPWGEEALAIARKENKPILISIGYSTCYWCHVMEREVFMNPSIAALMNEHFVNIKIDREEHPDLDEIYMVARQMMTREGGWPNNVFLTPDLKPFYAGGTFPASDAAGGRTSFPRLLEWLHYSWTTQQDELRKIGEDVTIAIHRYLQHAPEKQGAIEPLSVTADRLFLSLKKHHDESAGGFFQAPKFPHENYLNFLVGYYEQTEDKQALDMLTLSLRRMAAGGIHDHVGCGFHRYAVDKEWYVPHFEKMLYTQAMLARIYADAARLSGNAWFADIARSIIEFVLGPMTDGGGAFYAAIDAETDGVEGAYYAWTTQEFQKVLTPEETQFMVTFYALADIPKFPGHKHTEGQAIIARKGLDEAAREQGLPYVQLAAMCGHVMNKLLGQRNLRVAPNLDDKIIVSWNGLMIDALAHAGNILNLPHAVEAARRAADWLLEHAIDNDGKLKRIVAGGKAQIDATLEDYAFLIKGLLAIHDAAPDEKLLEAAVALCNRADELFYDKEAGGYFFTQHSDTLLVRIKSADDATLPNANAAMLSNLIELYRHTQDDAYRDRALALRDYFIGGSEKMLVEVASFMQASMRLEALLTGKTPQSPAVFAADAFDLDTDESSGNVNVTATLSPADVNPGDRCEVIVSLDIKKGWHVNANKVSHPFLVPTQVDVQGQGAELAEIVYPQDGSYIFEGRVDIVARLNISAQNPGRPPLKVRVRFQPCSESACMPVRDVSITV